LSFHNKIPERKLGSLPGLWVYLSFLGAVSVLNAGPPVAQVETAPSSSQSFTWVGHGRIDGHLALASSPDGAFAPDSSSLAVANGDKIAMVNLVAGGIDKVLHPKLQNLRDLVIASANFVAPNRLFLLSTGVVYQKGKQAIPSSLLGFQWDVEQDTAFGKVEAIGAHGGFGRPHYFPDIGYLSMYKEGTFIIWNPVNDRGGEIKIPDLTREPNLYAFSPDGHWLLLAQIAASGSPDPVVARLSEHKFVASLPGHQGTVMSMAFSRDSSKVVTACEDGKVRIWSVSDWKLIEALAGHEGPVHWAEFSPDGQWVASAGEDHTVRIWSVDNGKLVQTLRESTSPVLTVGFSPNGSYLAASTEHSVSVWQKTSTGQ
jgi:WD domain, G-beta repeat